MTVSLIYVHVARPDSAAEFNDEARNFMVSYKKFPPDYDHQLSVVFCNGKPTDELFSIYDGVKDWKVSYYYGCGMDVGAQQFAALDSDREFVIAINSRSRCHRAGWLKRMVECRTEHGPGIYGGMASFEGCPLGQVWPNPHLRTACYGMDASLWREFPHTINSREDSFRFESGEWNVANWCEAHGKMARLVTWDGCWEKKDWRTPPNLFRRGDQSNCLLWDRHTEIFKNNPGAHAHLEGLANGTP